MLLVTARVGFKPIPFLKNASRLHRNNTNHDRQKNTAELKFFGFDLKFFSQQMQIRSAVF